jgi:hypothetical protein
LSIEFAFNVPALAAPFGAQLLAEPRRCALQALQTPKHFAVPEMMELLAQPTVADFIDQV